MRIEAPFLSARFGIEREDLKLAGAAYEFAIHEDRGGLQGIGRLGFGGFHAGKIAGRISPQGFERVRVTPIDLMQFGIFQTAGRAAMRRPPADRVIGPNDRSDWRLRPPADPQHPYGAERAKCDDKDYRDQAQL